MPPVRLILEVVAMVRLVPVANVPDTMFSVPPLAIVSALFSVTVLPGLSIVKVPVRFEGSPVPVF